MMKKFMQIPDGVMRMYFELLTEMPLEQISGLLAGHPKDAKIALAKSVIGEYHGAAAADEAAAKWQREISDKEKPADIASVSIPRSELSDGKIQAAKLIVAAGLCSTTSDARRAIAQGGAYIGENKERIEKHDTLISVNSGLLLWVGKKRVARLELNDN
jgi:tyrosyl-tRNA synthetase